MQICQIWCGITRPCCAFNQYTGNSSRTLLVRFSLRHCSPHPMLHEAWANRYQIYNTQPTSIRSVDRPHHPQTQKGAPDCPWPCPRGRRPGGVGHFTQSHPTWGGLVPPSAGACSGRVLLCFLQVGVEWGDMGRSFPLWAHMANGTGAGACKSMLQHEMLQCSCCSGWGLQVPRTLGMFY